MLRSQFFLKTKKDVPKGIEVESHKLLIKGGFIEQVSSGSFCFLPLGWKVHQEIENIIRDEMNKTGGQEVYLNALIPKELWQKTGRWEKMDPPLFRTKDRHQQEFGLGPTHEEVITQIAKNYVESYKDLPFALYQIQNKFRNEMRFTGGLLRTREFIMKDLYSFHQDEKDLEKYFYKVVRAYEKIFRRCGVPAIKSEASGAGFAEKGAKTYEFQVEAGIGEDKVIFCPKCKWAANSEVSSKKEGEKCPNCKGILKQIQTIEVGHTFMLGTKYSKAFDLTFKDKDGKEKLVYMGCYGIGVGRLMATIIEKNHDEKGIIFPKEVAPFDIYLIPLFSGNETIDRKIKNLSKKIYESLKKRGVDVLFDDREDRSTGEKFADCDLIGVPKRIVISERTLEKDCIEIKGRKEKKGKLVKMAKILSTNY
ncbi:MAG TPA: His/Gly/Thr/Pro-type tRNA ligase C-terminal domain-containing protein [Candidatus Pacearchaeota archaeon]|nr:His/Gly/Thr/Pro-type tRNA ligase C-terminal domain-containing protein [Candidatus Pacearchaeota archaeon]HOK94106.1 His/Gly/Thr/Pro-type tRNA ligase C-terminal domain-containing protein [Candidatus Pacearchaeota archaeon]HPO75234.1 His/Gly/Thr/Pro-type tRNA ligase C-terminal domain-containing protein [Candidatus Pacearchaeota archaeon]